LFSASDRFTRAGIGQIRNYEEQPSGGVDDALQQIVRTIITNAQLPHVPAIYSNMLCKTDSRFLFKIAQFLIWTLFSRHDLG